MTNKQTVLSIESTAKHIFASDGYGGLSMRTLAAASGVGLSSIYHFFEDKDVLLKALYNKTNTNLGKQRELLRKRQTAELMLKDRVDFQFKYIEDVVFVLKYYLHYRHEFTNLPPQASLHIEEVLHKGISTGEFVLKNDQIQTQARIITHSINGFLLEYYPMTIKSAEKNKLVADITEFTMRSLKYTEVPMG